jgi:hypothetical protein
MTYYEGEEETIIPAEFTEKKSEKEKEKPQKEPGLLNKFATYVKKNQAAEAERRKRTGEPSFSEELSAFGSEWGKNLSKGMANVGKEEEAKLNGKSGSVKVVRDDDDFANDILFGKKKGQSSATMHGGNGQKVSSVYTEEAFIAKLCEFMRYVAEDDNIGMYRKDGGKFTSVDYKYLGKLLTRYYGHKVILKDRDLSIK